MEGYEAQRQHETEKKESLNESLEAFAFLETPFDQWTDEEKKSFFKFASGRLNNFYSTVSGVLDENSPLLKDETPTHRREDSSEKYSGGTYGQFYTDIRNAIFASGADLDMLRKRLDANEENRNAMFADPKKYTSEGLDREKMDNMCQFYLAVMPAVLSLLDSGYAEIELKR